MWTDRARDVTLGVAAVAVLATAITVAAVDGGAPSGTPDPLPATRAPTAATPSQAEPAGGAPAPSPSTPPASPSGTPAAVAPPTAGSPPAPPPSPAPPAAHTPTPLDGPVRPTPGVYTYRSGGEEGLAGSTRAFPPRTPMTLAHTRAGYRTELRPSAEHVDVFEFAIDGGRIAWTRWTAQRTFLGQTFTQVYTCDGGTSYDPASSPGDTRSFRCTSTQGDVAEGTVTVAGVEPVQVGGGTVDAVRLTARYTTTGMLEGTGSTDLWLHPATGLRLRETRATQGTVATPLGPVPYTERMQLDLTDLVPTQASPPPG